MFFGPDNSGASTPQKTLQSFVSAFVRHDRRTMESLVYNSRNNPALDTLFKAEKEKPVALAVKNIRIRKLSTTRVNVTCLLGEPASGGRFLRPETEDVEMVKAGGKWLIVAPRPDTKPEPGNLASFASIFVYPEVLKRANDQAKYTLALSNLKQLATAAIVYISENSDKIALKPDNYVKKLQPYARNNEVFTSPLDAPGTVSFLFNANLTDRDLDSMEKPENTVLFYEGRPESLNFRYGGKAAVGFCNGRVKLVTPEQAKTLFWK